MTEQPDQPARTAVYSELMWPEWNPASEGYGTGQEKAEALLDAHAAEVRAAVEPEPEAPEVYPTEVSYIGEIEESDGFWMYLTADRDRAAVEKRIASRQKQFPSWADGTPVRRRIVRKTTTYTVEEATP
jgi:hypothetical protein